MNKETEIKLQKEGSVLVLEKTIQRLRSSVHPCGIEEGHCEDNLLTGVQLADRVKKHCGIIQAVIGEWEEAYEYWKINHKQFVD